MMRYNKLLLDAIHRLNVTVEQFFRMAHLWKFGRDPSLIADVTEYLQHAIVPKYVAEYIDHIERGGNVHFPPHG
jgi:hypothetical protein